MERDFTNHARHAPFSFRQDRPVARVATALRTQHADNAIALIRMAGVRVGL